MTTLNNLLIDAESKLSVLLGGTTTLSNPSENSNDPLVQIMLTALAGQVKLDEKILNRLYQLDIRTIDCECLEIVASLVGEFKRSNKQTSAGLVVIGTNGTSIPANSQFKDNLGNIWFNEKEIIVENKIAFGKVLSTNFYNLNLSNNELYLVSAIEGISIATNTFILEQGYSEETCEQFRNRLLNKSVQSFETETSVIYELLKKAKFAKFINDYPDCDNIDNPCLKSGFVVRGGDDTEIASIIRNYAPINYINLGGNTSISFDCETVKFIRPCPVGIMIQYTGSKELTSSDFETIICQLNQSVYTTNFSSLDCIKSLTFRTIRQVPESLNCEDPSSATSCGQTVSLLSTNCPCALTECNPKEYKNCAILKSWEYPVFISAEYMGELCD